MKGFFNKVLRIDLSACEYSYDDISDEILKRTLGGKGLGTYLLTKENPVGVAPLSAENVFIIATGPVTGSKVWSQSRFGVFSKSPATGGFGESYCGGALAPKIKGCGVDAIVVTGAATELKYLLIDEDGVKFENANEIKGADTVEAENYILANAPQKAGAMVIGPAGENQAASACIKVDRWRSLGRGGLGAVMGTKNLKGIAFSGTRKCELADTDVITNLVKAVARTGKDSPISPVYQNFGTPSQVKVTNSQKCFPTEYWKSGCFDKWENISADYMQENFEVKSQACPNCFLRCTKHSVIKKGRHAGLELEGPEYETIYAIGGLNMIDSLEEIAWLNDICDRQGLDTMTAGNLSAFAVEAYKAGASDFEIDYNQPDRCAELYHMIANSEGFGQVLAKGIKVAARELGLEDIAVHVKGLEPGGFDPRVLKGMGLSYATSPRGACHLRGTFYKAELSGQIPKEQIKGKAELHIDYEDRAALFDSMVLCRFFRDFILWDELHEIILGTTGMDLSKEEMSDLANDITQATRAYNTREGLDASTDTLPKAFIKQANKEGAVLTEEELNTMLDEYNQIRNRTK